MTGVSMSALRGEEATTVGLSTAIPEGPSDADRTESCDGDKNHRKSQRDPERHIVRRGRKDGKAIHVQHSCIHCGVRTRLICRGVTYRRSSDALIAVELLSAQAFAVDLDRHLAG